jgi:hypothetical protein
MEAADSSKMLVTIYQTKLPHIPEHCNPNIQRHENLKPPIKKYLTLKVNKNPTTGRQFSIDKNVIQLKQIKECQL